MTMIVRGTIDRVPIPKLFRMVLKFIYDKSNCTYQEEVAVKNSVLNWFKYIKQEKQKVIDKYGIEAQSFMPVGTKGTVLDEIEHQLQGIGWLLHADEKGMLEERKKRFKEHNINYLKFYRIPEAYNPKDFKKAQKALERCMKENPDDYR